MLCVNWNQVVHLRWHSEHVVTHLYHVDDVVRQPEEAERHHDSQDEILAADPSLELGLPQASQDEDVTGDDDGVRKDEARHRLEAVLEPHLHVGGVKQQRAHINEELKEAWMDVSRQSSQERKCSVRTKLVTETIVWTANSCFYGVLMS